MFKACRPETLNFSGSSLTTTGTIKLKTPQHHNTKTSREVNGISTNYYLATTNARQNGQII